MDSSSIVLVVLGVLLVLLVIEMPIAFALAISGSLGLLMLAGFRYADVTLGSLPFAATSSFTLTIIPMFILMGLFAVKAKLAEQVYAVAHYAFRRLPGGLGVATVAACAAFAAVSGSSIGTAATMSKLSIDEMRRFGYPDTLASGIVAMAGTLGALIPPSTLMVLYAITSGESVAACLAAGILPGFISALIYVLYIVYRAKRLGIDESGAEVGSATLATSLVAAGPAPGDRGVPATGPQSGATVSEGAVSEGEPAPPADPEPARSTGGGLPWRGVVRIAILFGIVFGGMYSGYFTATEAAAVGAFAALLMLILEARRESGRAIVDSIVSALKETAATTSMVFAVVVGSAVLSTFFIAARLPETIGDFLTSLDIGGTAIMGLLLVALIPLGMFLDSLSILVITVPLIYPVAIEFGFSGVWLAVMIVKLIETGLVTPPVGINCFVVAGTSGIPVQRVFRGVTPLMLIDLVFIVVLFSVPEISLWLPGLLTT